MRRPRGSSQSLPRARAPRDALPLAHALALGVLHGPTELLPVSSSAHTTLVPWLLDWPYPDLDPELRKAFEVALHAGTAAALLIGLRDEVGSAVRGFDSRRAVLVLGWLVPRAVVGNTLARPIARRLGTPATIAVGLLIGSVAMVVADALCPQRRGRDDAGLVDALALGVAQACALMPGVSRNGATLTAARLRGFHRRDASTLSRHVALPIIVGATVLKGVRLARRGVPRSVAGAFAAAVGASFASTLASVRVIRAVERNRPFTIYAAYRATLAAVVLRRAWQNRNR
jgi:undecaprenyl-diphosphatase